MAKTEPLKAAAIATGFTLQNAGDNHQAPDPLSESI
jgi:hypothetical protein